SVLQNSSLHPKRRADRVQLLPRRAKLPLRPLYRRAHNVPSRVLLRARPALERGERPVEGCRGSSERAHLARTNRGWLDRVQMGSSDPSLPVRVVTWLSYQCRNPGKTWISQAPLELGPRRVRP